LGNARLVIGEGKDKKVVNDDEKFDSLISLKNWRYAQNIKSNYFVYLTLISQIPGNSELNAKLFKFCLAFLPLQYTLKAVPACTKAEVAEEGRVSAGGRASL
jgi:hypothetical protein